VAPFHPLRYGARAVLARTGAAFAVFVVIAALLLWDGSQGPLSDAAATNGTPGHGHVPGGHHTGTTPPVLPVPPVEPAPPADPVDPVEPVDPVPDTPDVIGEGGDGGDGQGAPGGEGVVGGVEGTGGDGDSGGGNDFEDKGGGGEAEPPPAPPAEEPGDETENVDRDAPGFSERRRTGGKPAGGAKGPEPSAGDSAGDPTEPEPAPASRNVLLPEAGAGTNPDAPGDQPTGGEPNVGDGTGSIVDKGDTRPS
jgi:hypothetical protein